MSPAVSETLQEYSASGSMPLTGLTPALYRDLRRIASRHLSGERRNHTLQPTALVNEAYLKLAREGQSWFTGDVHLLAVLSRVMRQVLVDYARARSTHKRQGQGGSAFDLSEIEIADTSGIGIQDLLTLDNALRALAEEDERLARVIEMRYFGGMTAEETAEALNLSVHIVRHDLRFAQAWLQKRLRS